MHWRIKGAVQKLLGYLPEGERLHYAMQRRFGGLRNFDREFNAKVEDWRLMANHLTDAGRPIAGAHMLEIGSGWYPTFPFACYLSGAASITTFDLTRHMKHDLVRQCAHRLGDAIAMIARTCGIDETEVSERHASLIALLDERCDLETATSGVVRYAAPADATCTNLPVSTIDCVFSNSVLEHVPAEAIEAMYAESLRILKPGGVMFHSVNCGDHYAYVDRRVTQLNYLKYSDRRWSRWNNAFLYQNRLRAHHFVERAAESGFDIVLNTAKPTERRMRDLAAMCVHRQFARCAPELLCITSVDFIARKRAATG